MIKYEKTSYSSGVRASKSSIKSVGHELFSFAHYNFYLTNHSKEEFIKLKHPYSMEESVKIVSTFQTTKNKFMTTPNTYTKTYTITQAAKILKWHLGPKSFYQFLRDNNILDYSNIPHNQYFNLGYFLVQVKLRNNMSAYSDTVTLFTDKGLDFVRNILATSSTSISI